MPYVFIDLLKGIIYIEPIFEGQDVNNYWGLKMTEQSILFSKFVKDVRKAHELAGVINCWQSLFALPTARGGAGKPQHTIRSS